MFEDISKVVLLSDMDGTLLSTDKRITDSDRRAIERFTELGGRFSVATGRTVQSFDQYRSMLGLKYPIIMYNGAAIYDYISGKTLYSHPLLDKAKAYVTAIMELMPDVGGEVLKAEGTYVFSNTDYQQLHTRLCGIEPYYKKLEEIEEGGWLKVLFAMSPEDVECMELLVKKLGYGDVDFVKSSEIFYEMLPKGVSKGSALAEYRKLSGMEDCTFVSVGDFDNDIEMIVEADLGACPANAEDSVKAKADLILTRTNDEGAVSELIEYIIERCRK